MSTDREQLTDLKESFWVNETRICSIWVHYNDSDKSGQIEDIATQLGLKREGSGTDITSGEMDISFGVPSQEIKQQALAAFKDAGFRARVGV